MVFPFNRLAMPIRRPAVVLFAAAMLLAPGLSPPAQARGPDNVSDVAEEVIDAVVNISTKQSVNIAECVDSVLTILQHRTKERIDVVTSYGEPARVDCYPALLNQVLLNLTANSIDAIEGRGRIEIDARGEGDMFVIKVTDSGGGIPDQVRERVLEPFFTTL